MTVTSGRKCLESYTNSGPLGCLVRMCLESSIWHSTRCLLTWKTKATKSKRLIFQLAVSMPRTEETESLFWPTPSTGAALCGGTGNFQTLRKMAERGLITEEERRQLSQGNGGKTNPNLLEWLMGYEYQFTKLLPTPTSSDHKRGITNRWYPVNGKRTLEIPGGYKEKQLQGVSERVSGMHSARKNWPDESDFCGIHDGVPTQLDRVIDNCPDRADRIKALGNAVVPQQFYPFFRAMADIENKEGGTT